jgi:predicted deacetylase
VKSLAVAIHDVEPGSFQRCAEIRGWLSDRGVDRVTLLVVPAPRLHPLDSTSPELVGWLRGCVEAGDAVAQHGLRHRRRRRLGPAGGLRASALGGDAAEFAGLGSLETGHAVETGLGILRRAGLAPRGFIAPAYYYSPALRREVARRFAWWAGLWRVHGAGLSSPALCLGSSSEVKRRTSPRLVLAAARHGGPLVRVDVHPVDFEHPGHVAVLERVLERTAGRRPVTYDELVLRPTVGPTASSSRRRTGGIAVRRRAAGKPAGPSRAAGATPPRPR